MGFKFDKYGLGGGGGDSAVVDVDALPTEGIDQSKIYRVTKEASEMASLIYSDGQGTVDEYGNLMSAAFGIPVQFQCIVVDTLPDASDAEYGYTIPDQEQVNVFYVIRDTWEVYYADGSTETLKPFAEFTGADISGVIADMSEATDAGVYLMYTPAESSTTYGIPNESGDKTVLVHTSEGGWVEMVAKDGTET